MYIKLSKEQKIKIINSEDLFGVMKSILLQEDKLGRKQEHFWVVALNPASKITNLELLALGKGNIVSMNPTDVFRFAIMKDTSKIILVHNHPTGSVTPSESDKILTDRLNQVGEILDITIVDHLIISTSKFYSFAEEGLMAAIKLSKELVPRYEEEERIRKETTELAESAKAFEMAIKMLEDGCSIELISKYTGLSEKDIGGME